MVNDAACGVREKWRMQDSNLRGNKGDRFTAGSNRPLWQSAGDDKIKYVRGPLRVWNNDFFLWRSATDLLFQNNFFNPIRFLVQIEQMTDSRIGVKDIVFRKASQLFT